MSVWTSLKLHLDNVLSPAAVSTRCPLLRPFSRKHCGDTACFCVLQEKKKAEAKGDWGGINKFLNRLLAVKVSTQTQIFQYFMALLVRCDDSSNPNSVSRQHSSALPCRSSTESRSVACEFFTVTADLLRQQHHASVGVHESVPAVLKYQQADSNCAAVQTHTVQQAKRLGKYNESGVVVPAGDIKFKDRKVLHCTAMN